MRSATTTALVLLTALLGLGPAPSPARAALSTVVQDDATLIHRPAAQVDASMARLAALGVDRVRLTAAWSTLTRDADAQTEPAGFDATDPGAYEQARFRGLDNAVRAAQAHGMRVLIDVGFWAPHWATTDPPGPRARTNPDPQAFADFSVAIARRYDGTYAPPPLDTQPKPKPSADQALIDLITGGPQGGGDAVPAPTLVPLPRVDEIALWNEPNHPSLLLPQWRDGKALSPGIYRRMVRAAYPAVKAIRPDLTILVGNTSSTGGIGQGPVPPLRFIRELACVDRSLRPLHTADCQDFTPIPGDGWAHHPYTSNQRPDKRSTGRRRDDVLVADLPRMTALLRALAAKGRIDPRMTQVHVTEFGYETSYVKGRPTLSEATQARWLTWAERIASRARGVVTFANFLLRDQPPAPVVVSPSPARPFGQFYTGLQTADGTDKLAAVSFVAGLQVQRQGRREVSLWTRLRLAPGPRAVVLQQRRGGGRWTVMPTRPVAGGPAARAFTADGRAAVTRVGAYRPRTTYRVVARRADGTTVTGVPALPTPAAG